MEENLVYRLTQQVKIFGWSCKLNSNKLDELLTNSGLRKDEYVEDAALIPVPNSDLVLVKSIDIFTPIIDEPTIMGEIAACNVTNDVFALNVPEISGMLAFLAIKTDTPTEIAQGILEGIRNFIENKINSKVVGGHTIYSEWPLMGGEASGFIHKDKLIRKYGVKKGDKLILTKPIGLQAIMAAYRLLKDMPEMLENYSSAELKPSIDFAINLMTTSNQDVVKTIHSYENFPFVHAMTDISGFGLAGHLYEMLQNSELSAIIETVPSIKFSQELSKELGYAFDSCLCSETAGGMLIAVEPENVEDFSNALKNNGITNWIIGTIDAVQPKTVRVSDKAQYLDILKL